MSDSRVHSGYVDSAVDWLRRGNFLRHPGFIPPAMVDPSIQVEDGWIGWKPVESTVTDTVLNEIEAQTRLAFPPPYRSFLKYMHFISLTEFALRFITHDSSDWKRELTSALFDDWEPQRIIGIGLLPFGSESFMDAGPVCFDTRARLPNGDCPVVFWDHEWVGTAREIQPMFSSSHKMFECLKLAANADLLFENSGFPSGGVGNAGAVIRKFSEIDPVGVGGVARPYWNTWN